MKQKIYSKGKIQEHQLQGRGGDRHNNSWTRMIHGQEQTGQTDGDSQAECSLVRGREASHNRQEQDLLDKLVKRLIRTETQSQRRARGAPISIAHRPSRQKTWLCTYAIRMPHKSCVELPMNDGRCYSPESTRLSYRN